MDDDGLAGAWTTVLERWDDERAHQAFLETCAATDQLAAAAACYRRVAAEPERATVAAQRLGAIGVLAIARLEATRTPATRTRRQGTVLALLALLVAALVALLVHLARLG